MFTIIFSQSKILWDLGVTIESINNQEKNIAYNPTQITNNDEKINAIIYDPFIPPKQNTRRHSIQKKSMSTKTYNSSYNINIKQLYLSKKYTNVIELIKDQYLNDSSSEKHVDLNFLLANSLFQTGDYHSALNEALSLLDSNPTDQIHFLLARIYESLGHLNESKKYYKKFLIKYPESDYKLAAKIKLRMLDKK